MRRAGNAVGPNSRRGERQGDLKKYVWFLYALLENI